MEEKNYHKTITTKVTAKEAFDKIRQVNKWWTANFKGRAKKLNDVFTVRFGENSITVKVVAVVPNKKLAWLVTECHMVWLTNKSEWKNTKIVFEISEGKNQTRIDLTHVGLVPGIECYNVCETGWNQYVGKSIPELLTTGKGILFDD